MYHNFKLKGKILIKSLKINKFKGLKSLQIKNLSKLCIIVGKNNCSKTSILEVLYMLYNVDDFTMISKMYNYRGISLIPIDMKYAFNSLFYDFDLSNTGRYKGSSHEIGLNYVFNYSREVEGPRQF